MRLKIAFVLFIAALLLGFAGNAFAQATTPQQIRAALLNDGTVSLVFRGRIVRTPAGVASSEALPPALGKVGYVMAALPPGVHPNKRSIYELLCLYPDLIEFAASEGCEYLSEAGLPVEVTVYLIGYAEGEHFETHLVATKIKPLRH